MFEKSSYIGGRARTVNVYDDPSEPVELGASIFVEANKILCAAAEEFGFDVGSADVGRRKGFGREGGGEGAGGGGDEKDATAAAAAVAPQFGVWNGKEFVYIHQGQNQWWDLSKLVWNYGLLAPMRTNKLVKATINQFLRLYEEWQPHQTLTDAAAALELTGLTSVSGRELLKAHSVSEKFANEIVQAGTRVNYAQNISFIHGLETMVSMAGAGAMSVAGGNWRIFSKMLQVASAEINLGSEVKTLEKAADGLWRVEVDQKGVGDLLDRRSEIFDTVVVASPFQYADLEIQPTPSHVPAPVPYVGLHVTLFTSPYELSASAFNLSSDGLVPDTILTTLLSSSSLASNQRPINDGESQSFDGTGFFSISTLRSVYNPQLRQAEYLYKVFSPTRLSDSFLCHILGLSHEPTIVGERCGNMSTVLTWRHEKTWNSYPYEYPRAGFEPHWLGENLWYTGGMDNFISTMETNALMGRKVASDIIDKWMGTGNLNV